MPTKSWVPYALGAAGALFLGITLTGGIAEAAVRCPVTCGATKRLPSCVVALARKWAKKRGIPVEWVIATIMVESNGDMCATGDNGVSIGLMQVNTRAHAQRLAAAGLLSSELYDPNNNIAWGTLILREAVEKARRQGDPTSIGVRNIYTGRPAAARDPLVIAKWQQSLSTARAIV